MVRNGSRVTVLAQPTGRPYVRLAPIAFEICWTLETTRSAHNRSLPRCGDVRTAAHLLDMPSCGTGNRNRSQSLRLSLFRPVRAHVGKGALG